MLPALQYNFGFNDHLGFRFIFAEAFLPYMCDEVQDVRKRVV